MESLKPYLVDVPVRVNIWIRTSCQRKQFEILKQARPSVMFLISDGGRNEKEWEAIRKNREIFDNEIDWECTIYKIYEKENQGLYTMSRKGAELIWSTVDRCIFLEDDQIPSVCYFKYCAELLEKYKDDTRVHVICAMNYAGVWDKTNADYFFAERGPIWGQATWKRAFVQRDTQLKYSEDPYVMHLLKQELKDNKGFFKAVEGYANDPKFGGHVPGGEFLNRLCVHSQNQLYIIPKYNMMSNIGCTEDSVHASEAKLMPRAIRSIFNMKTYEYTFPLNHPSYMIADKEYKNYEEKILGRNHPVLVFFRRIEGVFLTLKYKGISGIIAKIKRARNKKNRIEN